MAHEGGGRGIGLAGAATSQQGIPENVLPGGGGLEQIQQLLALLAQGGQIPPEQLMQLLALITGGGQAPAGPQAGGVDPIAAALGGGGGGGPLGGGGGGPVPF